MILVPGLCQQETGPSWARLQPWRKSSHHVPLPTQVLAGLLHLGNIRFADSEDEAQPCQLMGDAKCEDRAGAWGSGFGHTAREQGPPCLQKGQHGWDGGGGEVGMWKAMPSVKP